MPIGTFPAHSVRVVQNDDGSLHLPNGVPVVHKRLRDSFEVPELSPDQRLTNAVVVDESDYAQLLLAQGIVAGLGYALGHGDVRLSIEEDGRLRELYSANMKLMSPASIEQLKEGRSHEAMEVLQVLVPLCVRLVQTPANTVIPG